MTTSEKTTTEQSCGSVWMNGPDRVYLVKASGVCDGCVFVKQVREDLDVCPRTSDHVLACVVSDLPDAIFITEVEYLKRQMR